MFNIFCNLMVIFLSPFPKKIVGEIIVFYKKDIEELEELGFELDFGEDCIYSYKFGSA